MERRNFLSSLALGAGAGAIGGSGLVGCGAAPVRGPELGARTTNELLARLDRGLASARDWPVGTLAAQPTWRLRPDLSEDVLRTGIQALVVADVARSIPEGTRAPAELAQRLVAEAPVLARAIGQYHALLTSSPPAIRRTVDQRFRVEPATAMDVAQFLDERAADLGISAESRMRLRANAAHVGARIRRQSTNAVVDDAVAKVEAVLARTGTDVALARASGARALTSAIWQQVEGVYTPGAGQSQGQALGAPPGAYEGEPIERPPQEAPSGEGPGDSELMIGGILIGSGLAAFGIITLIGWAAGSAMWGAIIGATPGSILLIIGIVLLIIGGVQNARAD